MGRWENIKNNKDRRDEARKPDLPPTHKSLYCQCESLYCQCECQCARCREQRENPKPLPRPVPVSQEMRDWIRAEGVKWRGCQSLIQNMKPPK